MSNRIICILILVVLLTALAAGIANSASFTYASYRKEIKAGVLIFPSTPGDYSAPACRSTAPYLFQVLNNRTDIKPQGWDFVNPIAPSRVTGDIAARWSNAPGNTPYTISEPITKEMGCYWEVKIDAGLAELSQFDILYLGLTDVINLKTINQGRAYREKLRKLVDAGGVLWIENCSSGNTGLTGFFTSDVPFIAGGNFSWAGAPNRLHPLVHRPYDLAWDELCRLGTDASELNGSGIHRTGKHIVDINVEMAKYFSTVVGIGGVIGNPILAASQYGSGHIVASAESIGFAVSAFGSAYVQGNALIRNGTYCPADRATLAPAEDVKAAINIACWGGEHTTFHKNARHTGYSYDEVGAPLALKWDFALPPALRAPTGSSPAILNDMVFYVDGTTGSDGYRLHAFDLSPAQDRNGDGDPDDYVPSDPTGEKREYSAGAPYDEVWARPLGGPASSPTVAYVTIGGGAAVPAVFVTTQAGQVLAFNADTGAPLSGGSPAILNVNPYPADEPMNGKVNIPAPTYFDGTVYVGDGLGWLHANDLHGGLVWKWPLNPIPNLPPALNSPTVGYFRNPITGSVDQLVYLATRGIPSSANGCVYSFPIKIYNEVLTPKPGIPNQYVVRKYQTMAIKPGSYKVYRSSSTMGSMDDITSFASLVVPGAFQITDGVVLPGDSVIADYEVDMTNSTYPPNYRQRIDVKNQLIVSGNPPGFGVASTPAADPKDTLYYATENGSFYAVIEDGWGITTKWRWYLKDPGIASHPQLSALSGGEAVGSPAVGNDMVYFAVKSGAKGYILAFDADPTFRINVGGPIDPRRPVEVLQYDSMNPGREPIAVSGAAEGTDTTRRRVAFKIDYEKGRIAIENFLDPLSASQDIIVRFFPPTTTPGPGARIEQIHQAFPDGTGILYDDYWNNLAWCLEVPPAKPGESAQITSSPMLMGSMLYFGDVSGRLHALNVQRIAQTTAKGAGIPAALVTDDIHWVWPDSKQDPLGGAILSTVGGAQGNIAITSPEGLAVLHNALTLVADGRRVLEMDAAGRVVWSCDSTTSYTGTRLSKTSTPVYAGTKMAFNKPSVARRIGTSNVLVADTGNNRVVLIDRAGNVLCDVSEFLDPKRLLPMGTPLKLSSPTDAWMQQVQRKDPDTGEVFFGYSFLIADTGNHRVIEVEAMYNQVTGRYSPVNLTWTTRTQEQGKRYRYISARRYPKAGGGSEIICVVDNMVPETGRLETTGGAIVTIDETTGLVATAPADPTDHSYGVRRFVNKAHGMPVSASGLIKIVNPTFFSREFKAGGTFIDLIGDANGLYAVEFATGGTPDPVQPLKVYPVPPAPHRAMPVGTATVGAPRPLVISHAQLLPSGNVLVTNKASTLGDGPGYAAQGEVFELRDDFSAIVWPNPGVEIGRGSYPLEQPSSAERLLQ